MDKRVAVLGAGMVGVSCALELRRRGCDVVLIDRSPPGRETSYGNAGVLARSSLVPMNNPGLWTALPRLLRNTGVQLRYRPEFMRRHLAWAARFLYQAGRSRFEATAAALDALIRLSMATHADWLHEAGAAERLRTDGWIFLYRSEAGFAGSRLARETFARFGVATQTLSPTELRALEPALRPIFARALWIQDAASVDDPSRVVQAYADLFAACGGRMLQAEVQQIAPAAGGWTVRHTGAAAPLAAGHLVVALGPWSRTFLERQLRLRVPMAYERGYHMHYAAAEPTLRRPVYDAAGGYVLAPMAMGLRLSTGVELADLDAPPDTAQLQLAEGAAREALALGPRLQAAPWLGRRPTMPDSRPVIGAARAHPGLWFAFGHQHIGLSTGPGTALLLADAMSGQVPRIDATPFAPGRFGL
ncbi:NAD(P)/FAD-dependent oxidoreductase [Pseudorhodoferax sp.]|uniref:NAD(P)/FAD-dependent oxidoreductase n=1 Tax=Pseudorhodoferax sp. TaxID=1993553 RepID=UPI0039E33CE4